VYRAAKTPWNSVLVVAPYPLSSPFRNLRSLIQIHTSYFRSFPNLFVEVLEDIRHEASDGFFSRH
jgi:hypothetical protein